MSDSISIGWYGPTNDHWGWILEHFRDVTQLTDRNVADWILLQSESSGKSGLAALLIAVDSRFEPGMDFAKRIEQTVAPVNGQRTISTGVLLGDDWVGHRRTNPLPETMQTFYWYELYDRVLPWIGGMSNANEELQSADPTATGNQRRVSPRVQRVIDSSLSIEARLRSNSIASQMALVVSETATTRQLWCEMFASHEIQTVATTPENLSLWTKPDFIVVDLETEPKVVRDQQSATENGSPLEELIERLASQFPEATVVVADAFPRWENWFKLKQAGADLLVAKPFQLTGILDTLVRLRRA